MQDIPAARSIFVNAHIVTMDASHKQIPAGWLEVRGGEISALGPMGAAPDSSGAEVIDCSGCVLLPGLINCHTHLPMVYFRGLADDLPLLEWLQKHIFPAEGKHLSAQFVYRATLLAAAECIRGGTTCVNDMYLFEAEVARACDEAGLRGYFGEGSIGFPTASAPTWQDSLRLSEELAEHYRGHPRISASIAVHSPYTCPPELLTAAREISRRLGLLYHLHLHETAGEPEHITWREGSESPTAGLARLGILGERLIGAHAVWVSDEDIALLAGHNCAVAHCPASNLKLASGVMPLVPMLNAGLAVGLGTDGAASNNNLSMFEEINLAALLPKGTLLDAQAVPARTALELATSGAARALGAAHIGSLEPGKRADMIVVDMQASHLAPRFLHEDAVYSHLVYSAQAGDVRDTMVEGRLLMRGRQLTTLDEVALQHEAQLWVQRNYGPG